MRVTIGRQPVAALRQVFSSSRRDVPTKIALLSAAVVAVAVAVGDDGYHVLSNNPTTVIYFLNDKESN